MLEDHGIEISDDAELILSETNAYMDFLRVRRNGEVFHLPVDAIILIESYGHEVQVHTQTAKYKTSDRLRQLEAMLDPTRFIRISNSVIIARSAIRHIRATLSSKFILTLSNDRQVDVTRSYAGLFRETLGL